MEQTEHDERPEVHHEAHPETTDPSLRRDALASMSLLYESDDDRFALFEIFDGHLAAVDTSKLV